MVYFSAGSNLRQLSNFGYCPNGVIGSDGKEYHTTEGAYQGHKLSEGAEHLQKGGCLDGHPDKLVQQMAFFWSSGAKEEKDRPVAKAEWWKKRGSGIIPKHCQG